MSGSHIRAPAAFAVLVTAAATAAGAAASEQIAHYPLQAHGLDATGNNDPMILENAPFQEGGVYCNGIYWGDPGSYLVETPTLPALDFTSFAISGEFKIDRYPVFHRPVLIGGEAPRWMGAEVETDGTICMLYNTTSYVPSTRLVTLDEWHQVFFAYDGSTLTGSLYLDMEFACSAEFTLDHGERRDISTENFGNGMAFLGVFRELIVYDSAFDPSPVTGSTWGAVKELFR